MRKLFLSASVFVLFTFSVEAAPKNIILLIGDGMGEAEIALARAYAYDGEAGLYIDSMKNRGSVIVRQLQVEDPTKIEFVGESASGGTTISTGYRTSDGRVAVSAFDGSPIKTILEEASERGFRTGLVTTSSIADATPASFAAHAQNRYCWKQGDDACATHGDTPIIEQMLKTGVDVMLGGSIEFLDAVDENGRSIPALAKDNGYSIVSSREELLKDKGSKILGVFSPRHMPVEWYGPDGRGADFLKQNQDGSFIYPTPARCEENPAHKGMPTLEEMTSSALARLDDQQGSGFILMVEGASIDKQAHAAKPCGIIGEMLAFDRTVKIAVDYARNHENTAVIVTADHGGPTQTIFDPVATKGTMDNYIIPGRFDQLLSVGGYEVNVYFGTNDGSDQSHTGINVPIYTYGMEIPEDLMGVIQQTEIYPAMKNFLFN